MNTKIERTLIWFNKTGQYDIHLSNRFFGLSVLLNRLLNQHYQGKKIKFINIDLTSMQVYGRYPNIPPNFVHYYNGHLRFFGTLGFSQFETLDLLEKKVLVWQKCFEFLTAAAKSIGNLKLLEASDMAYKQGLANNLNEDYQVISARLDVYGISTDVSIWVKFTEDAMRAYLVVEKEDKILFEKEIDKTNLGVEIFLEIYKSVKFEEDSIVVRGRKDISYLPLYLKIEREFIFAP